MDDMTATRFAGRLAASFPSARIGAPTLEEWAGEFAKLGSQRAESVLEWIKANTEGAPTVKQIRLAMSKTRATEAGPSSPSRYVTGCEFCGNPVKNGPDAGARYDREQDTHYEAHLSCADARAR